MLAILTVFSAYLTGSFRSQAVVVLSVAPAEVGSSRGPIRPTEFCSSRGLETDQTVASVEDR